MGYQEHARLGHFLFRQLESLHLTGATPEEAFKEITTKSE